MAPRAVAHADAQDTIAGRALKRRGILAATAAVVAGMVAKQANESVRATGGGGPDGNLVLGSNTINNTANTAGQPTYLFNTAGGTPNVPSFFVGDAFLAASVSGAGVIGRSSTGVGVDGLSDQFHGIIGQTGTGSKHAGIAGFGAGTGTFGVIGDGAGGGGSASGAVGVQGQNAQFGVVGMVSNVANTIAVQGNNQSTGAGGIGVVGQCDVPSGIGVVGASVAGVGVKGAATTGLPIVGQVVGPTSINAGVLGVGTAGPGVQGQSTGGHGLVGTTSATDGVHIGLVGYVQPGSNAIALRGTVASGAVGYAGIFDGDVLINGALRVFGSPKNAAVKHPIDNTYRLLYCMESPESWFEDFGKASLVNGHAEVKLDPDFAVLVHADDYHVFLTSHDPASKGLAVAGMRADGFTVQEHAGGTSGGTFSWRVVAKRKDIAGERLAKVPPPPPLKPVTPFTVPERPVVKPPTEKP
jgi:hypothetical protein